MHETSRCKMPLRLGGAIRAPPGLTGILNLDVSRVCGTSKHGAAGPSRGLEAPRGQPGFRGTGRFPAAQARAARSQIIPPSWEAGGLPLVPLPPGPRLPLPAGSFNADAHAKVTRQAFVRYHKITRPGSECHLSRHSLFEAPRYCRLIFIAFGPQIVDFGGLNDSLLGEALHLFPWVLRWEGPLTPKNRRFPVGSTTKQPKVCSSSRPRSGRGLVTSKSIGRPLGARPLHEACRVHSGPSSEACTDSFSGTIRAFMKVLARSGQDP
jgi:hypothetical protein